MKHITLSILFTTFCIALFAQKDINGKISDTKNSPLEFANVYLFKLQDTSLVKAVFSETDGSYRFERIAKGEYLIAASMVGYEKRYSQPILIDDNDMLINSIDLQLVTSSALLKEVQVTAAKPFIEQQIDKIIVNVANSAISSGGTAMEVLEKVPGVLVVDDKIQLAGKSGVLIYIDGRPSQYTDVAQLLKDMPSSNIEKIELIHTPGAKYDAAGNAGIINIKLKKNVNLGTNGTWNVGAGYGRFYKANTGVSLNHRNGKVNAFGDMSVNSRKSWEQNLFDRTVGDQIYSQDNYQPRTWNGLWMRGGMDYYLNAKNTIGVVATTFFGQGITDQQNYTNILKDNVLQSKFNTDGDIDYQRQNYTANANYRFSDEKSGKEFSMDADYAGYKTDMTTLLNSQILTTSNLVVFEQSLRNLAPNDINIYSYKADYVHPFNKQTRLELGGKTTYATIDNNLGFERWENNEWKNDASQSNRFKYTENVNALYASLGTKWNKWELKGGLRMENTNAKGTNITINQTTPYNYTNLFPSAFLTRMIDSSISVNASYSRRITRPDYEDLNPFRYYLDPLTFKKGNERLQPQYADTYKVGVTYKNQPFINLSYSAFYNVIVDQAPDQQDSIAFIQPYNLARQDNYNIQINHPIPLGKKISGFGSLNINYDNFSSTYLGLDFQNNRWNWFYYAQITAKLPKKTSVELSGFYRYKGIFEGFMNHQPFYMINFGASHTFWKEKAKLRFTINDIFWTMRVKGNINFKNVNVDINTLRESRQARLTFTYTFGNNEIKAAKKRSTGLEEEKGRVKEN